MPWLEAWRGRTVLDATKTPAVPLRSGPTLDTMTEPICYGIAELDSNDTPIKYLPFLGAKGWQPGISYWPTTDQSLAWRFGDRQTTQETADLINSTAGNSPEVHVIELDCDGPPLNMPAPHTL